VLAGRALTIDALATEGVVRSLGRATETHVMPSPWGGRPRCYRLRVAQALMGRRHHRRRPRRPTMEPLADPLLEARAAARAMAFWAAANGSGCARREPGRLGNPARLEPPGRSAMSRNLAPSSARIVEDHYQRLGGSYDSYLHYSDDFVRSLTSKMIRSLKLQQDDVLVDLGGGTGMYTADILAQVPLRHPVTLVKPFAKMLANVPADLPIESVAKDALAFSAEARRYDKVLMKEAVHHVADRPTLFANLHARLRFGGRLLLVHVPPELDYPLFEAALSRSRSWHADPLHLTRQLQEVGFTVERDGLDFRHAIPKEHYFRMVEGRYMSLLSSFAHDELRAGLAEMAERYADRKILTFTDRFDFITAIKQ
jgi:SAM-dependent methyltransferase